MANTSHTTSCSDCKLEEIKLRWTTLLLNWLNKCVHPQATVTKLNHKSLIDIVNKYKTDVCMNEVDRAFLCTDDMEPFVKYTYPILRLKSFCDERDYYRKQYILTSVFLFHFCVNSVGGRVDSDICANLNKSEQELILKFCERLSDMEVTTNNVEVAVIDAFEAVKRVRSKKKTHIRERYKSTPIIAGEYTDASDSTLRPSLSDASKRIKFKSSVTVLPSTMMETSSVSDVDFVIYNSEADLVERKDFVMQSASSDNGAGGCMPDCSCSSCSPPGPCCGDPGSSMVQCVQETCGDPGSSMVQCVQETVPVEDDNDVKKPLSIWTKYKWIVITTVSAIVLLAILIPLLTITIIKVKEENKDKPTATEEKEKARHKRLEENIELFENETGLDKKEMRMLHRNTFTCQHNFCQKVYEPTPGAYLSWSRCVLHCMGPQIWPYPIGHTSYSKNIIAVSTSNFEYKFQTVPSEAVSSYLAEAFKLFIGDLARLERVNKIDSEVDNVSKYFDIKKMNIQIDVESDPEPRLKVNTDESYTLNVDATDNNVTIKIMAPSFCGVRHGLETLSQLILFDQTTGYLITLSKIEIKDAPSYKYRGLMIDTARNYIPVPDLMRTIDAMSTCKLNTFHWRISDVTSFSLLLMKLPQLFENGAYRSDLVYTKDDVKAVVRRARVRGIRVLLEVAMPGPVGRAWSWSRGASCPSRTDSSCSSDLCLRLPIRESVMDILQTIYSEIIEITQVDDIFHLSNGLFSIMNCYYLLEDREGFLEKALDRLKLANKGFLPKLPIVWYTKNLAKDYESKAWDRLGVQLTEWLQNPADQNLSRFKVIHSSRWDLSCEVKKLRCRKYRTWQDMYSWNSWKNIESFTTEGGEALLWTDLVDTGNLDYHLWPRAAAVAERLWSDIKINGSVTPGVYVRLDSHRWRMLMKSVDVRPIWPMYCSFNPGICLQKLNAPKIK